MGSMIPDLDACFASAMKGIDELEGRIKANLKNLCYDIDREIKALTPVNTGQAVRNYIWSIGAPSRIVHEAIDNGPPGPTNSMPLGQEPRRPPNEAAARETLLALDFSNPFQTIYLSNNSPDIEGLELGTLPGPPLSSRSPNGMFGLVEATITAKIASKGITS